MFFKHVLSISIIYIAIVGLYLLNKLLFFEFIVIFIILDAILAAILKTASVAFRPKMPEWHSTDFSCTWPGHLKSIITFSIYPKTRFLRILPFNVWTMWKWLFFKFHCAKKSPSFGSNLPHFKSQTPSLLSKLVHMYEKIAFFSQCFCFISNLSTVNVTNSRQSSFSIISANLKQLFAYKI